MLAIQIQCFFMANIQNSMIFYVDHWTLNVFQCAAIETFNLFNGQTLKHWLYSMARTIEKRMDFKKRSLLYGLPLDLKYFCYVNDWLTIGLINVFHWFSSMQCYVRNAVRYKSRVDT